MPAADTILCFEGYRLDRARCTLRWHDEPIVVTRRSFELLTHLVENPNRLLTKDALLDAVWPGQFVEESNLTQHVFLLRKALSRHGEAKLIETVPGRGYRLNAIVQEEPRPAAEPAVSPAKLAAPENPVIPIAEPEIALAEPPPSEPRLAITPAPALRRSRLWPWAALVAVLLVAVSAWGVWRWRTQPGGPPVQVVLMPVDGSTGDGTLDHALGDAVRIDLLQSPWITLVPGAEVQLTLQRMQRDPVRPLDVPTAQEVCERTNSQAVVQSHLAKVGTHFFFTNEAIGCVNGNALAAAHGEASTPEKLPATIAEVTGALRRKLGESRSSVARFSIPIVASDYVNASSLEALELDSEAKRLANSGKHTEAVELLKHALAVDPKFADAWFTLYTEYTVSEDTGAARNALQKAYDLRDTASPLLKLALTAAYKGVVLGDLDAAERDARNWIAQYPRYGGAYTNLYTVLYAEGDFVHGAPVAERALELWPAFEVSYANAATAERAAGHLDRSIELCRKAIAAGYDTDYVHVTLAETALVQHDNALLEQQWSWLEAHPNSPLLWHDRSMIALSQGRFADARRYSEKQISVESELGQSGHEAQARKALAAELTRAGETESGGALFRSVPIDEDNGDDLVALARLGDTVGALHLFAKLQAHHPDDTLVKQETGPLLRFFAAMADHHPEAALEAVQSHRWDFRDEEFRRARAEAKLAKGDAAAAEAEYRDILAHPEVDPPDVTHSLAWLGLGRALAAEHSTPAALDAYNRFLALWSHADPGAKLVEQASREIAALQQH